MLHTHTSYVQNHVLTAMLNLDGTTTSRKAERNRVLARVVCMKRGQLQVYAIPLSRSSFAWWWWHACVCGMHCGARRVAWMECAACMCVQACMCGKARPLVGHVDGGQPPEGEGHVHEYVKVPRSVGELAVGDRVLHESLVLLDPHLSDANNGVGWGGHSSPRRAAGR